MSETGSEAMAPPPPALVQRPAAPPVAPYHAPPGYPPPASSQQAATEPRAVVSLLFAILGLVFAIPLGLPGMIAGPIAYFMGKDARSRIAASGGSLTGGGAANGGRILGVVTMVVGALFTLGWLILIFNAMNDVSATG